MASVPNAASKFEIGRVISETFAGIKRNWLVLTIVSGGVAAVSALLNVILVRSLIDVAALQSNPTVIFYSPGYWGALGGGFILNAFGVSALLTILLGKAGGELPDAIVGGLRFALPMLVLTLLWTIGISLGMMLLVVPGVMLITMWSVSAPVLIAERTGIIGAFGRSRALTRGIRWNVFGALLVFVIVLYVIVFAIQGLGGGSMAIYSANMAAAFVIAVLTSIFSTLFVPSFLAALYVETINANEGGRQSELADVFS